MAGARGGDVKNGSVSARNATPARRSYASGVADGRIDTVAGVERCELYKLLLDGAGRGEDA